MNVNVNFFEQPDEKHVSIQASDGENLMRVAVSNGVGGVVGECGGEMSCATCHVFVHESWSGRLPPASADEIDLLETSDAYDSERSRLSCQIELREELDGIDIYVAPEN
ncbi:2Fe-2S iron-sulfur cluster-binding protein [Agrococcus baldri]|uniref:Ferredoxin n=1 Tax=Agrococcus baldri TaxID=153730 RepID=A0AA87RE69_9MICO|nr:2Fe-2S iron-sulfur cluster-binding protein [Agrococcus baldri]GEK79149.1 ferredoxin [Agrococcus baldri]